MSRHALAEALSYFAVLLMLVLIVGVPAFFVSLMFQKGPRKVKRAFDSSSALAIGCAGGILNSLFMIGILLFAILSLLATLLFLLIALGKVLGLY